MALFNKDWNIFKTNWQNTSGGFKNKFATIFNSNDVNCLKEYNHQIQAGIKPSVAYRATMMGCTKEAKKNAVAMAKGSMTYKQATSSLKTMTVSAKAATVAMKALSVAGNMLLVWAITEGIQLIVKGFDNLITTTEEYREKLEEVKSEASEMESELSSLNSELETTKQRLEELEGKGSLTFTEKEEYDNLVKQNNELQRSIDLLELEAKTKNKEKNKTFIDTMNSDTQSKNEYSNQNGKIVKGNYNLHNALSTEAHYTASTENDYITQQFEEREKLLEEKRKAETKKEKEQIQEQIDEIDTYLQSKSTQWSSDAEGIDYISNPTSEDDKAVNAWLDYIADFQDRMAIAMGGDNAKTNTFNRLVDNWQFDDTVQGLQDLGKEGKVTAEMLDDSKYDEFINKLVFLGVISSADNLEDIALAFNNIGKSADDAGDSLGQNANESNLSIDTYKTASDSISSLATAFKELSDEEYVSLETISKIKEAVGDSISNWDEYQQKLLTVKKGTAEYNQIMHDLTYATLENKLGIEGLANADEAYVTTLLKENGVINANEVAHDAVERAKAKEIIQSKLANDVSEESISSLLSEASTCDITSDAYISLVAQEIIFNNNGLKVSDKITALQQLAQQAKLTGAQYASLNALLDTPYGQDSATQRNWAKQHGFTIEVKDTKLKNGDEDWLWWKDGVSYENANEAALSLANSYFNDALKTETLTVPNYSGASSGGSTKSETEKEFNWIETALSRIQLVATNLGKTVSATWKSWTDRNSALKSQISAVNQEITKQRQAYTAYMSEANSLGLSSYYQNLVKNGAMDISTITDSDLADKISKYQEYYEAALSCEDAIIDLEDELRNLARTEFDNIAKQFDSEISLVEANISTLEEYIDQTKMKGNLVSKNYYSAMYAEESKNLSLLQQKYDKLSNALSNGTIKQGSEEFNQMAVEVKEVKQAIIESTTALEEYQKTMRELDWEVFDLIEEKIGNVTEESEFLIDLLSNSKLFNNDGSITSQGQATLGLHVANMRIYESQVKDYADELEKLDAQFANDSLDENYLERRQELLELQRESILNAQLERQNIQDLWSDGYSKLLDYMQEVSDKYRDMISQISDTRDFEKNIKSQVEEISRLENIWHSYQNDTSEEGKMNKQQIGEQLKEARENLEETEREQYLKDLDRMISSMMDDASEWQNARLDDVSGLIQDVVDGVDKNASSIEETLKTEVSSVGGQLTTEMTNLWSGTDGIKGVVGGVNTTLTEIKNLVQSMVKDSNAEASKNASGATSNVTPATKPATTSSTSNTSNNSSTSAKAITVGGMINAGSAPIYDFAGDTSPERAYYRSQPYYRVLDERNGYLKVRHQSLSSGTTGWFKKSDVKAYKTGGLVDETGLAWLDGTKSKPEMVLNAEQTENHLKLTKALETVARTNMFDAIQTYTKLPSFVPNGNIQSSSGDVIFEKIEMYGVNDPQEFARQLKDVYDRDIGNVRKMINTDVHSKYGSMNYRRYL